MAADFAGSVAFKAACAFALLGREQPCGHMEPRLHHARLEFKRPTRQR
jgi:malate synthase